MDDSAGAIAPLYEADKSAVLAWSPTPDPAGGALMAFGAKDAGGGFDDEGTELEVHRVDFTKPQGGVPAKPAGVVKTPGRFSSLGWSAMHNKSDALPMGLIAGGMAEGVVHFWDPAKLVASHPTCLVASVTKHAGSVSGLQFNPHRESSHLMATGGADMGVHVWSLDRPDAPSVFVPAPPTPENPTPVKHAAEVTRVAWNSQVAHILATSSQNGTCIVWDLRQKKHW